MSWVKFATIEDLGVRGCLYLSALLTAQQRRLRVAPTQRSTLTVLDKLRELGLIEVPWPDTRWGIRPNADITPIEDLQWAFSWGAYERSGLVSAIEDFFDEIPRSEQMTSIALQIWEDLAQWESEQFLEQQLVKHQFDAEWARDLAFVFRKPDWRMPIARWRYCCWAAVRHGAAVAQQQKVSDPGYIREAIYGELERRILHVGTTRPEYGMFSPFDPNPPSAVARVFVTHIALVGDRYWTAYRYPADLSRKDNL